MYISHKYKLIFLRTPKTASSSLSEFFIKNIPDLEAMYGPVEDSNIKAKNFGGLESKYKKDFKYYHFTLSELVNESVITPEQAKTYKVISVIRDPLDRHKSFFYFYSKWKSRGRPKDLNLYKALAPDGLFLREPNASILQSSFCKYKGVDYGTYWLYENIDHEINNLMNELNLPIKQPLPNHKANFRKNRDNEIVFDDESINNIKKHFGPDFILYDKLKEKENAVTN